MMTKAERDKYLAHELAAHFSVMERIVAKGRVHFLSEEGVELRYAAQHAIAMTAEALHRLGSSFKSANPALALDFRRFRAEVMHPYDVGSREVTALELWEFMVEDAPKMKRALGRAKFPK